MASNQIMQVSSAFETSVPPPSELPQFSSCVYIYTPSFHVRSIAVTSACMSQRSLFSPCHQREWGSLVLMFFPSPLFLLVSYNSAAAAAAAALYVTTDYTLYILCYFSSFLSPPPSFFFFPLSFLSFHGPIVSRPTSQLQQQPTPLAHWLYGNWFFRATLSF